MTRMTGILAALFFIISLALGDLDGNKTNKGSEWDNLSAPKSSSSRLSEPHRLQPASDTGNVFELRFLQKKQFVTVYYLIMPGSKA